MDVNEKCSPTEGSHKASDLMPTKERLWADGVSAWNGASLDDRRLDSYC